VATYTVHLLGKFRVLRDGRVLPGLEARKVEELFAYLLLHRGRPHARETLAATLWPDNSQEQGRKYLRQALWQLRTALEAPAADGSEPVCCSEGILRVESEWVEVRACEHLWIDVAELERASALVQRVHGKDLDDSSFRSVQEALEHYRGDLLEGSYTDWCLFERERLQCIYLSLLGKLMDACEARGNYEAGIYYGMQILRVDRTSERTHRRMMRLYYRAGDRSSALQQYQRCVEALREELRTRPDPRTEALYAQIRASSLGEPGGELTTATLPQPMRELAQFLASLGELQRQIQQQMQTVELFLQRIG
jgi:DNA-binding SARP family transcriptional activator